MIRPIRLTDEVIDECVAEFRKSITETRLYSGTLSYSKTFKWTDQVPPAIIKFSAETYMKMRLLLEGFSSEVAWQCVAFRDDVDSNVFHLMDIVLEPQIVTGVTVDTDQEEYEKWLMSLSDEVFNNLHANCHSHVNMATTPSATDKTHWTDVLNSLAECDDMFQIFMIWNKRMEYTAQVYDLKNNVYYDGTDIKVEIEDFEGWGLNEFMKNAKASVKTAPTKPAPYTSPYYNGGYYGSKYQPASKPASGQSVIPLPVDSKEDKAKKDRTAEAKSRKEEKAARRSGDYYGDGYGYWDDDDYWDSKYPR